MNHKIHGEIVQEMHEQQGACSRSRDAAGSVGIGDKVMIIGGYPMQRGLVGTVQRINTAKEGWCYVTVGGRIYSCQISDLLLQNRPVLTQAKNERRGEQR
jgi:hypothetical protein